MTTSHNLSVLLVDDSAADRMIVKAYLNDFGLRRVQEATDGKMAFFKLENAKIDLIITDWDMPVISGITLLEQIKKDSRFKKIPVIFFTGMNDKANVEAAIKIGVTEYLVKPIEKEVLLAKIKKLFPNLEWISTPKRP